MRIAFVSDIHGNLPALKSAVSDARARGADEVVCAGDIIGYGPFPNEVCAYLEENSIACISGNYDCKVMDFWKNGEAAVAALPKKKRELVFWTLEHIDKGARHFLAGLPKNLERELPGGRRLMVVHGSPNSNDDAVYPSITANGLESKLCDKKMDVLACGHTHIPFVKKLSGILIMNCGSAGHPVDGDPEPSYAILSIEEQELHGNIVRFEYDVAETVAALKKTSLPKGLQSDFAAGTKRRFL